jgi:hypothetical protein
MVLRRKPLKYEPPVEKGNVLNGILIGLAVVACCVMISFMIADICLTLRSKGNETRAEASDVVCTKEFVQFKDTGEVYEISDYHTTTYTDIITVYFTDPIEICDGIYAKKMMTGSENVYIFTRCFEDEQTNQKEAE